MRRGSARASPIIADGDSARSQRGHSPGLGAAPTEAAPGSATRLDQSQRTRERILSRRVQLAGRDSTRAGYRVFLSSRAIVIL